MFVLPAIDLKDGKCVRLRQGLEKEVTVYSDDPVAMALHWESCGADIIHVVDLDGAFSGEQKNLGWVSKICRAVKCGIQLGGGVRSREVIQRALDVGVRRVVLGTKALSGDFLNTMLSEFGEHIVVGIDARDGQVAIQGWTEKTKENAFEFAEKISQMGCQRLVFTDVQTDGMMVGPPLESIIKICTSVKSRVIASGGVSSEADVQALQNLKQSNLEGVIVGKALYEKKLILKK